MNKDIKTLENLIKSGNLGVEAMSKDRAIGDGRTTREIILGIKKELKEVKKYGTKNLNK